MLASRCPGEVAPDASAEHGGCRFNQPDATTPRACLCLTQCLPPCHQCAVHVCRVPVRKKSLLFCGEHYANTMQSCHSVEGAALPQASCRVFRFGFAAKRPAKAPSVGHIVAPGSSSVPVRPLMCLCGFQIVAVCLDFGDWRFCRGGLPCFGDAISESG